MTLQPDLPDLRILRTESLLPHEEMDESRAGPLMDALRRDGVLRNPPIVLESDQLEDRHVVLDGANRTTAFRKMGIAFILAQVVKSDDPHVSVETWNHVVLGVPEEELLQAIVSEGNASLTSIAGADAEAALQAGELPAYIVLPGGGVRAVQIESASAMDQIRQLRAMVEAYRSRCQLERTTQLNLERLTRTYPSLTCVVRFKRFALRDILDVVNSGSLFPPGITRFVIRPRVLRTNYPLEKLDSDRPIEQLQADLDDWVVGRLRHRRIRLYAEPTLLFDE